MSTPEFKFFSAARPFHQLTVFQNERNLFKGGGYINDKWLRTEKPYRRVRLSMINLFVKIARFIKD